MTAGEPALVLDVDPAAFEIEVVRRSRELPVIACFWAPWSAPSRAVLSLVEDIARREPGRVRLCRVNVDGVPQSTRELRVWTVPEVRGFHEEVLVARFVGLRPEPFVRRVLDPLVRSPATRHALQGLHAFAAGDASRAEQEYREALRLDPDNPAALLGLARVLEEREDPGEAAALYRRIPADAPQRDAAIRRLRVMHAWEGS